MRVAVVGGGVVGLCCAHELARRGAEVVVLERDRVGAGASLGNTGWVCPSFTYPLPGPGVVGAGLRGLATGRGPLVIHPSLDPTFLRWLVRFWRSSRREAWERGVRALLALNEHTLELLDAYEAEGVPFELHRSGLVLVARTRPGLDPYLELFRELRRLGFSGETAELGPAEACELEPALARGRVHGGVHALVDRYVRPESLTAGLAGHLAARGVDLREGVEVEGIAEEPAATVRTAAGPVEAERVIVATGPASPGLLARLGVRMPLVGARGYSLTVAASSTRPRHALYLAEAKVGVSAYRDAVRLAGVFELGRREAAVEAARLEAMARTVEPYFERWRPLEDGAGVRWAGLRPMTGDGLPLIGRSPAHRSVFVATGHGMLGVTLAPATASLLAPLVLDDRAAPELAPFGPAR